MVAGVRWIGGPAWVRAPSRAARRRVNGQPVQSMSSRASRSKATRRAGVWEASRATRLAAGWMRSNSASEVEPPTRWVGHHDLPVDDAAGGQLPLDGVDELGEVAGQRALLSVLVWT